jgi:cardiolipin-specific phospholipase
MTSLLTTIFTSQSARIAGYVETMRQAESSLMVFARRFSPLGEDMDFSMELIDTPIPRSVIPLKEKKASCQMIKSNDDDDYDNDSLTIHSVKVTSSNKRNQNEIKDDTKAPIVLLHGYANGALYFYRNLFGLASSPVSSAVYALDLLGWGLSSRPRFDLIGNDPVEDAESFFVESLEAWRIKNNIPKMILGGHSMGGYLSVAYAEKYPANVERLILLSPVGIPDAEINRDDWGKLPLTTRLFFGTIRKIWDYGITPSGFIRSLSEYRGQKMVSNYIERRIPAITDVEEREALINYLYTNAILPGSGENCLNAILKPGAFARKPAVYRIPELKVKDVSFVYGQRDWMDPTGGLEAQKLSWEKKARGEEAPDVEVIGVRNAGHLLMLDNYEEFNSAVILSAGGKLRHGAPRPLYFNYQDNREGFFQSQRISSKRVQNNEENTASPGVQQ